MSDPFLAFRAGSMPRAEMVRRLFSSFVVSQAVYVAAKLGIADQLVDGDRTAAELAESNHVDGATLYRVLRLLEGIGMFRLEDGRFGLAELGECLRSDAPDSVRDAAILFGEEPYRAAGEMLQSVTSGESGFQLVYGMTHVEYLNSTPSATATFQRAMTQLTTLVTNDLVGAINLDGVQVLVDVGGGEGSLLAGLLHSNGGMRAIMFEDQSVLPAADELLTAEGLRGRCELIAGDLFEDGVPVGGDAYLVKSVLHGYPDDRAVEILEICRAAMAPDARLLVVERVVPEGNDPLYAKVNDLVMLAVTGGRERTSAEYDGLLDRAGFELVKVTPTDSGFSVVEARRSSPATS
jgi:hypothetical protein